MEDPKWLRLVTIGLVLAAIAVGYFLLTGRLTSNTKISTQTSKTTVNPSPSSAPAILGQSNQASPTPVFRPTPAPASAYSRIIARTQNTTQTLPNTGFPVDLAVAFSFSSLIVGWGLRRFPH